MALSKSFTTPYGVSAVYWKIANVTEDFMAKSMKIVLAGYVSAEARQADAQPLVAQTIEITGEAYVADANRAAIYAAAKAMEVWTGAEDC